MTIQIVIIRRAGRHDVFFWSLCLLSTRATAFWMMLRRKVGKRLNSFRGKEGFRDESAGDYVACAGWQDHVLQSPTQP